MEKKEDKQKTAGITGKYNLKNRLDEKSIFRKKCVIKLLLCACSSYVYAISSNVIRNQLHLSSMYAISSIVIRNKLHLSFVYAKSSKKSEACRWQTPEEGKKFVVIFRTTFMINAPDYLVVKSWFFAQISIIKKNFIVQEHSHITYQNRIFYLNQPTKFYSFTPLDDCVPSHFWILHSFQPLTFVDIINEIKIRQLLIFYELPASTDDLTCSRKYREQNVTIQLRNYSNNSS